MGGGGGYFEFINGFVSWNATNNNKKHRASYDFNGGDGRSYTLTEGTNTISKTYIDGQLVSSLEDMIDVSFGGLHNVVVVLSNPSTSVLTLFGNSSGLNSPNVTVETVSTYSGVLSESEISFAHKIYRVNNITPVPVPRMLARDVSDFSVDVLHLIDIDDITDFQALTSANFTGAFDSENIFSLNADLDFSGETKSAINGFKCKFFGNGHRLSNHDGTYFFNYLYSGASIDGVIFHNFNGPSAAVTNGVNSGASVTNCVCCGTWVAGAAFARLTISDSATFRDNIVMVSGSSRFTTAGMSSTAPPMTRCFFAGTSDVFIQGNNPGTLVSTGSMSGENGCNFNGYMIGRYATGALAGQSSGGADSVYACGSFDLHNWQANYYSGRIVGSGAVSDSYYYGSGDISNLTNRATQTSFGTVSATAYSERRPSMHNSAYLETDFVVGTGHKGGDTSKWAGGSFDGPDILVNVPHIVPIESFDVVYDPIGTIQLHLTNVTDYPVFMMFRFEDPDVSVTVLNTEYREISGFKAKIVSRHHTLKSPAETVTNPSGLEFLINTTEFDFDALVAPSSSSVVGAPAKTITDFSVYIGDIIIGDYDDLSALFRQNYLGTFHPGNRFIQSADVQYPESPSGNLNFTSFQGVFDGNGFRILDLPHNLVSMTSQATVKNVSIHNTTSQFFSGHNSRSIVKNCRVTGDILGNFAALTGTTNAYGIVEDCHVLASGNSIQNVQGAVFYTANQVKRVFLATQPGHFMSSGNNLGGITQSSSTRVFQIACNMRSDISTSNNRIGLVFSDGSGKGFYGCGNSTIRGLDNSVNTYGISMGTIQEYFSANSGDIVMQSSITTTAPPGRGTVFSEFTGKIFTQNVNNSLVLESDISGNQGAMYSHDMTFWTAPWDISSHLDYPSILVDVPHFIPLPDEEVVKDIACTIQMYASTLDGYAAFFEIRGDRFRTDYHVDLVGNDGLYTPVDGTWVVRFTFPFEVEASKNIVFRGTTLTSLDSKTYVIGGIPFAPFTYPTPSSTGAKNVTDFSVYTSDIITMSDLADFQAVIGVSDFHPRNVFNMTADVDLQTITDYVIFNNFEGTFDGKGFRVMNINAYVFTTRNSSSSTCNIKNVIFYNTFTRAPVLNLYGLGKISSCVSCGVFGGVSCGLVQTLSHFSSVERCFVLASGRSSLSSGMSSGASSSQIGVSKSFFCGASTVSIDNGNNDTGCIGRSLSLGGDLGVNFLGSIESTADVGGIAGESKLINGLGYYVCGDFTLENGQGTIERSNMGSNYPDEAYYANKGALIGGGLVGPNNFSLATAFAEFSGTLNGNSITEDVHNTRNGGAGVYSRAPGIWWSPWSFVTTRPSFLKETPHFIPVENSLKHVDILGEITVEMENLTEYPVFVRVDYLNETDTSIRFFTRKYAEIASSSMAAEIVFPLEVDKNVYHGDTLVTSADDDNLTYNFGAALGTLVPGIGPDVASASTIADFSAFVDTPITLATAPDVQAVYLKNYTGSFNTYNAFYVTNDIDLRQDSFDATNDRINGFRGAFNGQGFKLSNHQGFLFNSPSPGMVIRDVVFAEFAAGAINGQNWEGENLTFVSGSLVESHHSPIMGSQNTNGSETVKNIRVFLYGTATFHNAVFMQTVGGASELFLATTSGIASSLSNAEGVMCGSGACGFNVGCNLNGTLYIAPSSNNGSGVLMGSRNTEVSGGGYYASGNLTTTRTGGFSWHTFNATSTANQANDGGTFTAIRGPTTLTADPETIVTDSYLGSGSLFQTAFKGFVQGVAEDQTVSATDGGVYDINLGLWVAPWVLADHLDHPSVLRAVPHYTVVEDENTVPSILGDARVVTVSYPVFLEIAYLDGGDGTDSFTYTVLNTALAPVTNGVVCLLTYPFPVRPETSIVFDNEAIVSTDRLSYLLGDPIWFDKSSPISFKINWLPVDNAESYRVSYELGSSGEIVHATGLTESRTLVQNLTPESSYLIRVYSSEAGDGTGDYSLRYTTTAITAANVARNYTNLTDEVVDETTGVFDMSELTRDKWALLEDIVEEVFEHGSRVTINVDVEGTNQDLTTTLVHRGSSVSVEATDALLTGFDSTGTDQFIEIETQNGNERMDYDPVTNTVEVGGVTYEIGDSVNIGGKRLFIFDS